MKKVIISATSNSWKLMNNLITIWSSSGKSGLTRIQWKKHLKSAKKNYQVWMFLFKDYPRLFISLILTTVTLIHTKTVWNIFEINLNVFTFQFTENNMEPFSVWVFGPPSASEIRGNFTTFYLSRLVITIRSSLMLLSSSCHSSSEDWSLLIVIK